MTGIGFEERVTALELDMQSMKIIIGMVDNKVERVRADVRQAQAANTPMIQAVRDDMTEFRQEVSVRFDSVDARFDAVDSSFTHIDARLDRMDSRFDAMGSRLDRMDSRFDGMGSRLDRMDSRFDRMDSRIDEVVSLIRGMADGRAQGVTSVN
ncbi:hypothetical protein [Microtetraspora malaysiensis]|uniref:t-SNARE coiled-coil homology domain-containing protein n=1 Tax=Microtetraspora malaysiensis TaxID=161358 RepID=A0ABW6T1Y0_9ACTN